jgi:effector-binding domain-containing protein
VPLLIPGAKLAVTHHHGSPAHIDLTHGTLGGYVMKHEIRVEGPGAASTTSPASSMQTTKMGGRPRSDGPIFRSDPEA